MTPSSRKGPRPLDLPRPLPVRTDSLGVPVALRPDRRWLRVDAVQESWRIDDEWWRTSIHRIYYRLVLEDGAVTTLFRDLATKRWYLQ